MTAASRTSRDTSSPELETRVFETNPRPKHTFIPASIPGDVPPEAAFYPSAYQARPHRRYVGYEPKYPKVLSERHLPRQTLPQRIIHITPSASSTTSDD